MALITTINEGVTSILRSLEHHSAIFFFVNNSDWHLRSAYMTPPWGLYKVVWDSFAVGRLQQVEQKAVGRQRNLGLI
jgi:hypothetical protein